jgi:pimeloyl-ACP methyl ester carboxylesterase
VNSQASAPPIVLVHGLWLTPRSWEGWKERFESRGHRVLALAWPRMRGEVEEVRRFQAAFANLNPRAVTKVDFHKDDRPPLLIMGNDKDHTVPASVSKEAAQRLGKSKTVVDCKEFAERPHFTAGAPGWEKVADYALDWANRHTGARADRKAPARA